MSLLPLGVKRSRFCNYYLGEGWVERYELALWKPNGRFGAFPPPQFQAVVDSVLTVRKPDEPIDLHMIEIMEMKHKSETDTT